MREIQKRVCIKFTVDSFRVQQIHPCDNITNRLQLTFTSRHALSFDKHSRASQPEGLDYHIMRSTFIINPSVRVLVQYLLICGCPSKCSLFEILSGSRDSTLYCLGYILLFVQHILTRLCSIVSLL
jgi:hypothetical protein